MTKMYGSYSDEDLNEWERLPLNAQVLTSSAFGAWLLRRDERKRKQEPKTGHWIEGKYKDTCDKCRCTYPKNIGFKNYCPNCGAKMESEDKVS